MPEIKEKIDGLSPIKKADTSIIVVHAEPEEGHISIKIDADITTLGVVAKILLHRYNTNVNNFIAQKRVPEDTDAIIQGIVNDYILHRQDKITMVRKDINNGQD